MNGESGKPLQAGSRTWDGGVRLVEGSVPGCGSHRGGRPGNAAGVLLFCLLALLPLAAHAQHSSTGHTSTAEQSSSGSTTSSAASTPSQIVATLNGTNTVTGTLDLGSTATTTLGSNSNLTITSSGTVMTGRFIEDSTSTMVNGGRLVASQSIVLFGQATLDNGVFISPQTIIGAGGRLAGSGVVQGDLINAGDLSPSGTLGTSAASTTLPGGNGVMTVTGNYTQQPGSTLAIRLDSQGNYDRLVVGGQADVGSGSLRLLASQAFYPTGAVYPVLSAAGGNLVFSSISQPFNSPVLAFVQRPDGSLTVTRSYQTQTTDPRGRAVAAVLNQAGSTATPDMQAVISAMDFSNTSSIKTTLSQLNGETQGVSTRIALNTATTVKSAIQERTGFVREGIRQKSGFTPLGVQLVKLANDQPMLTAGLDAGNRLGWWGLYVRYLGGKGSLAGSSERTGYSYVSHGISAGAEKFVTDALLFGVNGTFLFTNTNIKDQGSSKAEAYSYMIGPYVSYFRNNWHFDLNLSYTLNNNHMWRNIVSDLVSRQARSNYASHTLQANLLGGHDIMLGDLKFSQILGVDYAFSTHGPYREYGAGALSQNVQGQETHSLKIAPGIAASYPFETRDVTVTPSLYGQWVVELLDDNRTISSSLQGMPGVSMNTPIAQPIRNTARIGGAVTVKCREIELRGAYEANINQERQDHTYSLGMKITF